MSIIISVIPKWRFDASRVELPKEWIFRFLEPATGDELVAACQDADCLLAPASFDGINKQILQQIAHLKLIQIVGAGFDRVDITAATRFGIPVANVPGANANAVAEFTVGLMIALQRQITVADQEVKSGRYSIIRQKLFKSGLNEISGNVVGLVGLGAIGLQVARILNFLGASVYYYSRSKKSTEVEIELGIKYKPLDELLSISNIVSVHVPLNTGTCGLIGSNEFELMQQGSLIVNTARGEVIDQGSLAAALEAGQIAGAAVDVVFPEPPPGNHPLLTLSEGARDRLLITPHIAGVTVKTFGDMLAISLKNISRVLSGDIPQHVVNTVRN
jgi:phosphoglycerate dehydrogenase-like enzyme